MKKILFISSLLTVFAFCLNAQNVAINSTGAVANTSAMLDVSSTNTGVLIPRVALTITTSNAPIGASIATSLLVYNTATINDVTPGFYYWSGSAWIRLYSGTISAWNLTGNSGTNPATNFIGTTDGQDWVIRTNNTERARVLSGGSILFNRTTALYATDLFEAQGSATFPDAINGYTNQAGAAGVYGENSSATGDGIVGGNTAASGAGTGTGVFGSSAQTGAAGIWGSGGTSTRGVIGSTNNATYGGTQGQNSNAAGIGVVGINSAAAGTGNGIGVWGQTDQGGGAAAGVYGYTSHSGGSAIIAYNSAASGSGNGIGLYAQTAQSGASACGVYSNNTNAAGTGLISVNSAASGAGFGDAIVGISSQQNGTGAFVNNQNASGTAIMGAGNNQSASYLVSGSGGAFTGTTTGVYGYAASSAGGTNKFGGYFANAQGDYLYVGGRNTTNTQRKVEGTGSVNTVVTDINGNRVTLTCPETPDILFMDYGHGKLINGKASITIDPTFSKNILVDNEHPLKVFIQLEGECNGVYVTNKTAAGFDVVELNNGSSDVEFSYNIVAQRADEYDSNGQLVSKYVVGRFAPAMPPISFNSKDNSGSGFLNKEPAQPSQLTNVLKEKSFDKLNK